jgi:hypothetical protein
MKKLLIGKGDQVVISRFGGCSVRGTVERIIEKPGCKPRVAVCDTSGTTHIVDASKVTPVRTRKVTQIRPPSPAPLPLPVVDVPQDGARARAVPKDLPTRSAKYRAYVRTLPCAHCHSQDRIEASHHGHHGVATKPDDLLCIPLCWTCHREEWHRTGTLPGKTPAETRAWLSSVQLATLRPWLVSQLGHADVDAALVRALVELHGTLVAKA